MSGPEEIPGGGAQLVAAGATLVKVTQEAMQAISVQRPRDLEEVNRAVIAEIDRVQSWAKRAFYRLKFGDSKPITGASVYLTRLIARQFGNCSVRTYLSTQTEDVYQLAGVFIDLESNYLVERLHPVSIYAWRSGAGDGRGHYVTLTGEKLMQALSIGASKAERNAVTAGVPDWILQAAFRRCMELAADDTKKQLGNMIQRFASLGVSREQLDRHFDGTPLEKLTLEQYADLRGMQNALEDREMRAEEVGQVDEPEGDAAPIASVDAIVGAGAVVTKGVDTQAAVSVDVVGLGEVLGDHSSTQNGDKVVQQKPVDEDDIGF